jgi:amidase
MTTTLTEDDVAYAGVLGQAELLRSGKLTAPELVDVLLRRIRRLDPVINAFRTVRADAARAEAADAQRAIDDGDTRLLLGVPFAVKDNLDVTGETTEHGTTHAGDPARDDSVQIRRMRAAGMIALGKTTMPELALWPFGENRSTGITRNPWDTRRTPGGSSSGSAAAVAAGFVAAATATDGGGSIRIPAACCGLVGLKPAPGLVPGSPPDHWKGLSAAGVVTRDVAGTAAVLDVCIEPSPGFADALTETLGALRVLWTDKAPTPAPLADEVRQSLEATLATLAGLGATITQRKPPYGAIQTSFVPRYLAGMAEDADHFVPNRSMLEPRTQHLAWLGRRVSARAVDRAQRQSARMRDRMLAMFADADLLVLPTLSRTAAAAGRWTNRGLVATASGSSRWVPFCPPWNTTGLPALSFPTGLSSAGLPLAVQLVAPPGSERLLLGVAAALERARGPFPQPPL